MSASGVADSPHRIRGADEVARSGEISLLDLLHVLVRYWRRIAATSLTIGALWVMPALFADPTYTATATFLLQDADQSRAGLAGLAGQFGVALPPGATAQSPQFYAELLRARSILEPIARDSFRTAPGRRPEPLVELLNVSGATPALRVENALRRLSQVVFTSRVSKTTGVITVSATTQWPAVSRALMERALSGLSDFTLRVRKSQAAAERRFSEERLEEARGALRQAENRMEAFLQSNRQWQTSPTLILTHDRLQRETMLQQQVYVAMSQSFEDARAREMRKAPVITVIDPPESPVSPDPRGRVRRLAVGLIFGAFVGFCWALGSFAAAARRHT